MNEYFLKEEKKWSQITFFEDNDELTKLEIVKKTYFTFIGFLSSHIELTIKAMGQNFAWLRI